ncbi:MAG: hypothetical protein NZ810_03345 [Dehalococcoidia bacterium]|nr:hypothetical protein [Dehalococcoidia bacterium]
MKSFAKFVAYLFGLIVALVLGTLILARFADGPLEIIAGGPFETGEVATGEPDWGFAKDYETVEFQLLDPAASRTTWLAVHDGRVFIPSGYMTTWWGKIWKQWPLQAEQDGRAILRVDGKLYDRQLVRVMGGPEVEPVMAELSRKYGGGAPFPREAFDSGYLWIFELVPRGS